MKHTHYNYAGNSGISGKRRNRLLRDHEFHTAYLKALDLMFEMKVSNPRRAAIEFTVHHFQPRYHVSLDRATAIVSAMLRGKRPLKPSLQSTKWVEITERVKALRASCPGISIARATEWVLDNCRASRFFITPTYAYNNIRSTHIPKFN